MNRDPGTAIPSPEADPVELARWGLHCYCPEARRTPHDVLGLDDNWPLLLALRDGLTVDQLRIRGVSESRLRLLDDYHLVEVRGHTVRTAFPILGRGVMEPVRRHTHLVARDTADLLSPVVAEIQRKLDGRGIGPSGYAVVFGYLLDGLLWPALAERGALPAVGLEGRPHWAGLFWALHPRRDGPGTNFTRHGSLSLVQVWDADSLAVLTALSRRPETHAALAAAAGADQPPALLSWPGIDRVPVITRADILHEWCARGAGLLADQLLGRLVPRVSAGLGLSPESITVIVAHELIWDVLEGLVRSGQCTPPRPVDTREGLRDRLLVTDWARP